MKDDPSAITEEQASALEWQISSLDGRIAVAEAAADTTEADRLREQQAYCVAKLARYKGRVPANEHRPCPKDARR